MTTDDLICSAYIDDSLAVQRQRFDRRPSHRCQTNDQEAINRPHKVFTPIILTWVE